MLFKKSVESTGKVRDGGDACAQDDARALALFSSRGGVPSAQRFRWGCMGRESLPETLTSHHDSCDLPPGEWEAGFSCQTRQCRCFPPISLISLILGSRRFVSGGSSDGPSATVRGGIGAACSGSLQASVPHSTPLRDTAGEPSPGRSPRWRPPAPDPAPAAPPGISGQGGGLACPPSRPDVLRRGPGILLEGPRPRCPGCGLATSSTGCPAEKALPPSRSQALSLCTYNPAYA